MLLVTDVKKIAESVERRIEYSLIKGVAEALLTSWLKARPVTSNQNIRNFIGKKRYFVIGTFD